MKVALVHDWFNTKIGGAESLVFELAQMYPEAPIYTLLYEEERFSTYIDPKRVHASYLQRLPQALRHRSRYLLPLVPTAIEQFDLSEYDVVISSSAAFAKGIITRPETLHICYCNTPMRFVWDYWPRYVGEQHVGPIRRAAIHLMTSRLRLWDYYSAARVDRWIANSQNVARRIEKYYRKPVDAVIYPGADLSQFYPVSPNEKEDYFVIVGSLTPYKKIDMAVEACNRLSKRLIIAGSGLDSERLKELAGPTVELVGRVSDARRAELIAKAQAFLFPNEEDFGITPIEAMASGTPVIAYNKGGLTETVIPGKTGIFFNEPTVESLIDAIASFDGTKFKQADMVKRAAEFSTTVFRRRMKEFIEDAYGKHRI